MLTDAYPQIQRDYEAAPLPFVILPIKAHAEFALSDLVADFIVRKMRLWR